MESTAEQNRAIDIQHVGGSASPAELDATPTARPSGDLSLATTPNQVLAIVSVGMILANLDLFFTLIGLAPTFLLIRPRPARAPAASE
jgi:hypothetical protein